MFATIIFTIAVTFAMVALIYFQWYSWSEPSSMVAVEGDAATNGVVVEIQQVKATETQMRAMPVMLTEANGYAARFFLEAGYYRVTAKRSDAPTFSQMFDLPEYRKLTVSLAGRFPSTAPAATPARNE